MKNSNEYEALYINTISALYKDMLIHWYQKIIIQLEDCTTLPYGICELIKIFYYEEKLCKSEYEILITHFTSIPRPLDANKQSGYYWNRGNRVRRIEFLKEIIKILEDDNRTTH